MVFYQPSSDDHRVCDHPDCDEDGLYRAPKSRLNLQDFHWFCLDHVRAYNKSWNYCAGMSEDEIEGEIRRSTVWDRPTWPSHLWSKLEEKLAQTIYEGGGFYGYSRDETVRPSAPTSGNKALATLGLHDNADFSTIKSRYRELVKQHHPDRNGGDPAAEERFKNISQAFHTLKRVHEPDKVH